MKRLPIIAVALSLLAIAMAAPLGVAAPVSQAGVQPEGISVLGEGVVLTPPNRARIVIGVEVVNLSLTTAQAEAAQRADAIIERLRANGIAESDIRTVSYTVHPQYDQNGALRGFRVQNLLEVRTSNIDQLGPLLDQAVEAGASQIHGIQFEAEDVEQYKVLARDEAMQNARQKAEQLARNAGVSLGRVLYIEESDTGGVTPLRADAELASPVAMSAPRAPTPIQPGELQIRTIVRVVWAIQ